jgi:hypothetical protein
MADQDNGIRKKGSDRTNLSEQSMRSLSASVGSLAQQVRALSTNTARVASRGATGAAKSIGGAAYGMKDDYGFSASKSIGVGVASAVNPFAGELVRRIVDSNKGALGNSMRSMMNTSKSMLGTIKSKLSERPKQVNETVSRNALMPAVTPSAPAVAPSKSPSRPRGRRLTPNSYSSMYGSSDQIEALDRLRISNADWLKSTATMTKKQLRSKKLPKANVGGIVRQTGKAIVHEGEAIVPAEALVGQYAVMKDIRDMLKEQGETISNISGSLGNQDSVFMQGIQGAVSTGFKNNPGMQSLMKIGIGLSGMALNFWRMKSVAGPASKYARLVVRRTPLETIAEATVQTYGELRWSLAIITRQLNSMLDVWSGDKADLGDRSKQDELALGTGFKSRLQRFALSGDVMDLLFGGNMKDKASESILGRVKKLKPGRKQASTTAMIMGKPTTVSTDRAARSLAASNPAAAIMIQQSAALNKRLQRLVGLEKAENKLDKIDNRDETHYQNKHMAWLRNNPTFNNVASSITSWADKWIKPTLVGIGGGFTAMLTWLGFKKGGKWLKPKQGFSRFMARISGLVTGNKAGMMAGYRAGDALSSGQVGRAGKLLGNIAKSGALRGLGGAAKIGGKLFLPAAIVLSVIDGMIGFFRAGKIFDVLEPTIKQRFAAAGGGILDGLFSIIRIPLNLMLAQYTDKRIGSMIKPLSEFVHDVIGIVSPIVKMIGSNAKFIFKGMKLAIGTVLDIVTFVPRLLMNPKKTIEKTIDRVKQIALFFIDDLPNQMGKAFGFIVDSFFKFAEMGAKWVEGIRNTATDVFTNMILNWKSFATSMFEKGKGAVLSMFDIVVTGLINMGIAANNWMYKKLVNTPLIGEGILKTTGMTYINPVTGGKIKSTIAGAVGVGNKASAAINEVSSVANRRAARFSAMGGSILDQLGFNSDTGLPRSATARVSASDAAKQRATSEANAEARLLRKQQVLADLFGITAKKQSAQIAAINNQVSQTTINNTSTNQTNNNPVNQNPALMLDGGSTGIGMGR